MSSIYIYHSADLDGYCSGAIMRKFDPQGIFIPYDYHQPFPGELIIPGSNIVMAEVSLPMEEMDKLSFLAGPGNFTWIDHHVSAIRDFNDFDFITPFVALLNPKIAACEAVWQFLFPQELLPKSVELLGAYDTWRQYPLSRWERYVLPFQYGMRLKCNSLETFPMEVLEPAAYLNPVIQLGNAILSYQTKQNQVIMKAAFEKNVGDLRAICCNMGLANMNSNSFAPRFNPEEHDLMLAFCMLSNGRYKVSFYTEKPDIDVSLIAKGFGGGGHRGAAGCTVANMEDIFNQD